MKSFQALFMLFAALAMASMVNAEGHTNATDMDGDMGMPVDDMEMHNATGNATMDDDMATGDRDVISSAGRIGAMASVAAIVAGSFAF